MAEHYPIFLNLTDAHCLIIGGGKVAERKIDGLLPACPLRITVISPKITSHIRGLARRNQIEWHEREATLEDLDYQKRRHGLGLVFLCTNFPEVQRQFAQACQERSLLVNVADEPRESFFLSGSVVRRGAIQVAISSGAESPSLAAHLREKIDEWLDPGYAILARLLGELRRADLESGQTITDRRRQFRLLMEGGLLEAIRANGEEGGRARILDLLGPTAL